MKQVIHNIKSSLLLVGLILGISMTNAETLIVGSTTSGKPFTFLDTRTNQLDGVMVDIITHLGEKAGVKISLQQTPFSALIPSLTSKKIDLIAAGMIRTEEREKLVAFTNTVYRYGEVLFVQAENKESYETLADLKGEIVGAQVGTIYVDALNKKGYFKEVRVYDSIADLLRDVANGRIKAGLADQPVISIQLQENKRMSKQVRIVREYKPVMIGDVSLVLRKEDSELLKRLNKVIQETEQDGSLEEIIAKWGI